MKPFITWDELVRQAAEDIGENQHLEGCEKLDKAETLGGETDVTLFLRAQANLLRGLSLRSKSSLEMAARCLERLRDPSDHETIKQLKTATAVAICNMEVSEMQRAVGKIDSEHRQMMPQGCAFDPGVYARRRILAKIRLRTAVCDALRLDPDNQEIVHLKQELNSTIERDIRVFELNHGCF